MIFAPSRHAVLVLIIVIISFSVSSCSVEASRLTQEGQRTSVTVTDSVAGRPRGATIDIAPGSPADTVRAFYKNLRERKFREALYLTNLRPAIEGLTDAELKDFQVDFEAIAAIVPADVQINGEIVTGDMATVTAKLPDEDAEKLEIQEIKLRNEAGVWVILSADEEAEKRIKQEGKNYFFALRIETHQAEAKKMLDRISKAQMVYSLQNGGLFADIPDLIKAGLLPDDAASADSTGYRYSVKLSADKKKYSAAATPAEYGKTGKLSFTVELDGRNAPKLSSKDSGH